MPFRVPAVLIGSATPIPSRLRQNSRVRCRLIEPISCPGVNPQKSPFTFFPQRISASVVQGLTFWVSLSDRLTVTPPQPGFVRQDLGSDDGRNVLNTKSHERNIEVRGESLHPDTGRDGLRRNPWANCGEGLHNGRRFVIDSPRAGPVDGSR